MVMIEGTEVSIGHQRGAVCVKQVKGRLLDEAKKMSDGNVTESVKSGIEVVFGGSMAYGLDDDMGSLQGDDILPPGCDDEVVFPLDYQREVIQAKVCDGEDGEDGEESFVNISEELMKLPIASVGPDDGNEADAELK